MRRKSKIQDVNEARVRRQMKDAAMRAYLPIAAADHIAGVRRLDRLWRDEFLDAATAACRDRYGWTPAPEEADTALKVVRVEAAAMIGHVARFFRGQPAADGNPIPKEILFTARNLYLVYQARVVEELDSPSGTDMAYEMIKRHLASGRQLARSPLTEPHAETALYASLVARCRGLEIPIEYQSGTILVYLQVCEGIDPGQEDHASQASPCGSPGRGLGGDRGEPAGPVQPPRGDGGGPAEGGGADDALPQDHRPAA